MDRALLESRPGPTAANWLRQPPHFTTEKTAAKPWQDATDTDPMFLHDVKHLKQKYPRLPDGSLSFLCSTKIHGPEKGDGWRHAEERCDGGLSTVALRQPGCLSPRVWHSLAPSENNPRRQPGPRSAPVSLTVPHRHLSSSFRFLPYKKTWLRGCSVMRHICVYECNMESTVLGYVCLF